MPIVKYFKSLGYTLLSIIIFSLVLTTLNYFNIFNIKVINILELIGLIASIFIGGFYIGKRGSKKGYLEGLKIGIAISIFFFIIAFLAFDIGLKLSSLLYYGIILMSAVLGSIIGINKKTT